jgi:subtilisin family serine protease/fibronectin type 3 domain-containing protein/methionine-rich copper-binding protein CopC
MSAPFRSRFRSCGRLAVEALEDRTLLSIGGLAGLAEISALAVDPHDCDPSAIIVRFRPDAAGLAATGQDVSGKVAPNGADILTGTQIARSFPVVPGLRKVRLADGVAVDAALAAYRADPRVLYAEPDYRVHLTTSPNDPQFASQWALNNVGQTGGKLDADIDAPEAWNVTSGSGNAIVAVIDTGVDYTHPDLAANMWVNTAEVNGRPGRDDDGNGYVDDVYGYDFINHDGNPMDDNDHGTHVAGTIGAAGNNGVGVAGINWRVKIMALKFLDSSGSGSTSDAIEALNYAVANGATISNNSWGGDPYSQALYDAIRNARDAGHIFVTAAGNGNVFGIGQNNDAAPFYPASYDLDNVVAVAATDHNDNLAGFSNYGAASVDLAAPGVDILSTTPNNTYSTFSGTSMATPHVAGAIAMVRDLHPDWTYRQVIDQVLGTVDPVPALQGKTASGGRLNLAAAVTPDTAGPQIVATSPAGDLLDPVSSLRVTFNEAIDVGTFTTDDMVSFSGPAGPISVIGVVAVPGTNNRQFDVTFATQSAPGSYSMVLGPMICDRAGSPMDQNGNASPGETPGDQFTAKFTLRQAVARFDFGTAISPVAQNYTRVTYNNRYTGTLGYGWQSGLVSSLDRGVGSDLNRDFNYAGTATFAMDLPNGNYDVIATLGDSMQAHDLMGVYLEGMLVDTVTTLGGQFSTKTYSVSLSDGQLTLLLKDLGGIDAYVMLNALDVVVGGPDTTGPQVREASPTGTATGPVDRITLTFTEAIAAGSFTVADVASLTGPSGAITSTGINKLSPNQYEVLFAPQNVAGSYSLTIGPDVTDLAGNPMDQDGDKINGEIPDDQFTVSFTLQPGPTYLARYDFGTATSPVAKGYTRVTYADRYTSALGYGWQSGLVSSLDRGVGSDLTRDFNYAGTATFAKDLPNGNCDVTVTLGDSMQAHDLMGVYLEGMLVDTVTTLGGQFSTKTYSVSVGDGQLTLLLKDLGGKDAYVMLNALDVALGGPDTTGPQVRESSPTGTATGPVDRITLTFNEAIADGSFTVADVASLTGPGGAIPATGINKLSPNQYEVLFAPQNVAGSYSLTIGPDVADLAGNPMDQDGDKTPGEVPDDQYTISFTLQPGPTYLARYDFGTAISPVAKGYSRVTYADRYTSALGYGWQSGLVSSLDRGVGSDLTRDFNYAGTATFAKDLPNGNYDVTVTLGDSMQAHDLMGVYLEGMLVDTVTTLGGQFSTKTYSVSAGDGQLTLLIKDLGGKDAYVMLNALEIAVGTQGATAARAAASTGTSHPPSQEELLLALLAGDQAPSNVRPIRHSPNALTGSYRVAAHDLCFAESGERPLDELLSFDPP